MDQTAVDCAYPNRGVVARKRRDLQTVQRGMKRFHFMAIPRHDAGFFRAQQDSPGGERQQRGHLAETRVCWQHLPQRLSVELEDSFASSGDP